MKNYKSLILGLFLTGAILTACGNQKEDAKTDDSAKTETTETTEADTSNEEATTEDSKEEENTETENADEIKGVSKENNIVVDKENKTVTIYTTFNGKFLTESTRHLVVSESGKFGDKPVFISYVSPADFHQALLDIGAEAGNNMTPENAEETTSEGSHLDITAYWAGNEDGKNVNEIVKDSNGKDLDIRFTGNLDRSNEFKTGCISCLDSCTVGITSNANYPLGSVEKTKIVEYSIDKDNAPEDGTPVALVYSIRD
ncbi:YdjY domain-containing protein [Anaerococcus sp. Marseille-P3625]|uniref:YdjY domain-containing protein n=1 Tax=Anaerococcus sp. Marseille-P3625 TaxID=1977277 RepID=UPI000C0845A0|nr:YdjY domain-containing protein [Anaerococcus sp. Marseille-P3625]